MGWQRSHDVVIKERFAHWFLYKKTLPMDLEQMVDLIEILGKPIRLGWDTPKKHEVSKLVQVISTMLYKKHHPAAPPLPVEVDDGSE
jgi:hypothetical protein